MMSYCSLVRIVITLPLLTGIFTTSNLIELSSL
jgi:hypothetical protein